MKISEWFSDEIQAVRDGSAEKWPFTRNPLGSDAEKLLELEALRDEALRLEALDNVTVPADG